MSWIDYDRDHGFHNRNFRYDFGPCEDEWDSDDSYEDEYYDEQDYQEEASDENV